MSPHSLDNVALSELTAAFLDSRRAAGRSPATVEFYRHVLARLTAVPWPPGRGDLAALFLELQRAGLSEATISSYWRGLSAFLNWAVRCGYVPGNPLDDLPALVPPDPTPRAIPQPILRRLFAVMESRATAGVWLAARDHALFRVIYASGLRASEAANLRPGDVDLGRGSLLIVGKGKKRREVFLGEKTAGILARWLAMLHPASVWLWPSALLTGGARPLTRSGLHQALHRWCDRAGMKRFRVHDLRHSYCVHALRAGISAREVSDQAGHSDVAFTLRVYGKTADEDRRRSHLMKSPGNDV